MIVIAYLHDRDVETLLIMLKEKLDGDPRSENPQDWCRHRRPAEFVGPAFVYVCASDLATHLRLAAGRPWAKVCRASPSSSHGAIPSLKVRKTINDHPFKLS